VIRNNTVYHCPAAAPNAGPDYAMVAVWSGAATNSINLNYNAVVLYEVAGGQPALRHPSGERGRYDDLYSYLRSIGKPVGMNLGYADGHCKWRSEFPPQVLSEGRDPHALSARTPSAFDSFRWQLRRLFFGRGEMAREVR
jgi:prepilin-type processing-associated H-X9-DG protein